jgi:membrane-bound serine protease (ClpP class)
MKRPAQPLFCHLARGLLASLLLLLLPQLAAQEAPPSDELLERRILGRSAEESLTGKVVVIHVGQEDLINKQAFRFWKRTIERADEDGARAIVLELDTPGGLAFDTRDFITDQLAKLQLPVISWVEREALSAGALIAFATDRIYMAPGTTIGSAAIVNSMGPAIEEHMRAKLESSFTASMRAIAEEKGHRFDVLRAMMVIDEEEERSFGEVTVHKGDLLNLTAKEATQEFEGKPLLAAGIAGSLDDVLAAEGLDDAELIRPQPTGFEQFAWWIAAISPLLIAVGVGAAWLEIKAPGFGLFGFTSLAVFTLFFFGNNLAGNLAGYELMALFLLGILLILLEIFIFPGLVAGIIGAMLVIGSLWFAMADRVDFERVNVSGEWLGAIDDLLLRPGAMLAAGLLGAVFLLYFLGRHLDKIPLLRSLVAEENLAPGPPSEADQPGPAVDLTATALSDLRPTGTILVEGRKHDAISSHGLIPKGTRVRVLEEGMTYRVEPLEEGS